MVNLIIYGIHGSYGLQFVTFYVQNPDVSQWLSRHNHQLRWALKIIPPKESAPWSWISTKYIPSDILSESPWNPHQITHFPEHSQLIRWKSPVVPQADRSHRRLDLLAFADRSLPAEPSGVPVVRRGRNRKADGHNCGLIFWRVRARNDMNSYDWTIDLSDL